MIILDTNVISEPLRQQPTPAVLAWLDAQPRHALYITSINAAELWAGVAQLPRGKRRTAMESSMDDLLARLFGERRLGFDMRAARAYAQLMQRCAQSGTPLPLADGLIAAIALVHGFAVASRDTGPFIAAGIETIDPWGYRLPPG